MRRFPYSTLMRATVILSLIFAPVNYSFAGGLFGDIVNVIAPGAGTAMDDVNREIKEKLPIYKSLEEGLSNTVNETLVQATAPALQELIGKSRDDALNAGVQPIPANIRQNLSGFISDNIMNKARFRVGGGGDLTLQVNSLNYGDAVAITLDYVIVFKDQNDAMYNPVLWSHELTHVAQYQSWGIHDFSIKYLRNHSEVEKEAYDAEARYIAYTAQQNSQSSTIASQDFNAPIKQFGGTQPSNICGSWAGSCQINATAPVGTPCWCGTAAGPVTGALVPVQVANNIPPPIGLPSGFIVQACGCWGPNVVPLVPQPQCMSGQAAVAGCQAMCPFGGQAYGYMCQ